MKVRSTFAALALLLGATAFAALPTRFAAAQDGGLTAGVYQGDCTGLGGAVTQLRPLQAQGQGADAIQTSFTTIDGALTTLAGSGYSIAVDSGGSVVACGEISGLPGADLFIGLREQGGSGYSGIAWLHARDQQTQISLFVGQGLGGGGGTDEPFPPEPPVEPTPSGPEPPVEPTPDNPPVQPTPDNPPVQGTTYTSPTYGFTFTYGSDWQKVDESSEAIQGGQLDYLAISNGLSFLEVLGMPADPGVDANDCIAFWQQSFSGNANISGLTPRPGEAGGNASQAFAAWDFTFTPQGGEASARSAWVGCWDLPGQSGVVAIIQQAPTRGYEQQAPERDRLV